MLKANKNTHYFCRKLTFDIKLHIGLLLVFICCNQVSGIDASQNRDNLSPSSNLLNEIDFQIATTCQKEQENTLAIYHFKELLKKTPPKDSINYSYINYNLAKLHYNNFDYLSAIVHTHDALQYSNVPDYTKATLYSLVGNSYISIGVFDSGLDYLLKSNAIKETLNDSLGYAYGLYDLAGVFYYQKIHDKSITTYEKSLKLAEKFDEIELVILNHIALGSCYEVLEKLELSQSHSKLGLNLAKSIDNNHLAAYAMVSLASTYMVQKEFQKSKEYYLKVLENQKKDKDQWGLATTNLSLGHLFFALNNYQESIKYYKQSLDLSLEIGFKTGQSDSYFGLANSYYKSGKTQNAWLNMSKHVEIKDSLVNEASVNQMLERNANYEILKKESKISILKKENEILATKGKISRLRGYLVAIAFLLVLMAGLFLYSRFKSQKKISDILLQKANTIKEKNKKIEIQNDLLQKSNKNLEQFAYVASHDLKEPLRMINSFSGLLDKKYHSLIDDRGKEYLYYITDAVSRMETLLDDLLSFSKVTSKKPSIQTVATGPLAEQVKKDLHSRLRDSDAELHIVKENMPTLLCSKSLLAQLMQNLVSNAVKFRGERAPVITVDCFHKNNEFVFSIADNGIGIPEDKLSSIFDMFNRLHTRQEYEGTGIGLSTCQRIVESFGGRIWVESELGQGSTFFFTMPAKEIPELVKQA